MMYSCSVTIRTKRQTEMTTWRDYYDQNSFSKALDKAIGSIFEGEETIRVKVEKRNDTACYGV